MIQSDMKEKPYEAESRGTSCDASENPEKKTRRFVVGCSLTTLDFAWMEAVKNRCVEWSS